MISAIALPTRLSTTGAPAPAPSPSAPAPTPTSSSPPAAVAPNRKLQANPLFGRGVPYDEFQLSAGNLSFAAKQFGLDDATLALVQEGKGKFSVVYHTDNGGVKVDALRVAANAGHDSVFTAYSLKSADFDPSKAYPNELITPLGNGKFFGTVLASKQLAVPASADPGLKQQLTDNGYALKSTSDFGTFGFSRAFKDQFGLTDGMGVEMYALPKTSFAEKFKVFYKLFKEDPEYRTLKIGDMMGDVGAAMLLGVITPKLWEQGTAYGIASTISSIGNIGEPAVGILGESLLGSVVDNAVNSDHPLENLKKVNLATAGLDSVKAATYFAMHPAIMSTLGKSPGTVFVGLYGASVVAGGIAGVMEGKASMAIHDQLINKAPHQDPTYVKNFYQILGVEGSVDQALYLGAYSATVAVAGAFPATSIALAGVGAGIWAGGNFIWSLYRQKPEVKTTIEAGAYVHQGNHYIFDTGWDVAFDGADGKIVQDDAKHFSISFDQGTLYVKNDKAVTVSDHRHLTDYIPGVRGLRALGEKERWDLDDGSDKVKIARYDHDGYHLQTVSDHEFVVTRDQTPNPFWTQP